MYERIKRVALSMLRVSAAPPEAPAGLDPQTFRAAPNFVNYRYLVLAMSFVPALFGEAMAIGASGVAIPHLLRVLVALSVPALILGAAAAYFTVRLDYECRYYLVTDRSLRIREGVWIVRELTLTFVNVQNVSIEQGPIERLLGIANVIVDTAGGGGGKQAEGGSSSHRGVLRGIANAEAIRDLIRRRLESVHQQSGLGDPEDAQALSTSSLGLLGEIHSEAARLAAAAEARSAM